MGCIGITHPQIGKKWPSTREGLYLDSNSVKSLLRMRRGREGRVLWAPTHQHKPCFEFWNLRSERMKVLVILSSKGYLWKNISSWVYSPNRAPVMVLCLMSPIGKIHLLPILVQCQTFCANSKWEWMSDFVFMFWLVVSWSIWLSSRLPWCISNLEMDIWIVIVSNLCWEFVPSRCYLVY